MSDINDFKDLKIWQKGMDIAEKSYFLTKPFGQGIGKREQGTVRKTCPNIGSVRVASRREAPKFIYEKKKKNCFETRSAMKQGVLVQIP
jgi:hypothetical protein